MSLILEALRKSEAERLRAQGPGLHAPVPVRRVERVVPGWGPWVAAALGVLLLAGTWWVNRPVPVAAPVPATGATAPVPVTPAIVERPPAPELPALEPVAEPPSDLVDPSAVPPPPPVAAATEPVAPPPPAPEPPSAPVETPAPPAAEALPTLASLAPGDRAALPPLKVSMFVWSPEPARRFAIVDGQRVGEGALLAGGTVVEIRQDGVVLEVQGRRVLLGAPLMFVELPSRAHRTRHWAAPMLAIVAIAGYVAWLLADDPVAFLQRWGLQSGLAEGWRTLLEPARMATPFTALFLHASAWHLAGNGLFLLIFGVPAERALGPWRLLALFLLGGVLANLFAAALLVEPGRVIVGASGGISAIIGAYLVLFPRARLGVVVPLGLWLEWVRAPAALLIGLWVVLQYLLTFAGPAVGAVAWWSHLGGFVAGVLLALAFRSAVRERKRGR